MSSRAKLSITTALLMAAVLYFTRSELVAAWNLLARVDLWILATLIPLQFASYYAGGATVFSYLRQKAHVAASPIEATRIALEFNFVNHILPSGGVSGASYMTWRMSKLGVGSGRGTMAQVVRFAVTFAAYMVLLVLALVLITIDGQINRFTILVTSGLASSIICGTIFVAYIIDRESRLKAFAEFLTTNTNKFWVGFLRRPSPLLKRESVTQFFEELHSDYRQLKREPKILVKPFLWALLFNVLEVAMFEVAFWALGTPINPAPLMIAYGLAVIAGFFMVTPGGAGGYEVVMITFLSTSGISQAASVAAIVLVRVLQIVTTILSGYVFYQLALNKYGGKRHV